MPFQRKHEPRAFEILSGLTPPVGAHPLRRTCLDELVELANKMEVGQAALLTDSEATHFRTILVALGFHCTTDGWRSPKKPLTLAFKLLPPSSTTT